MNAIVIEHVKVGDLPEEWRTQIAADTETRVTVRIEQETSQTATTPTPELEDDPIFGMWRDRAEMNDVDAHVRKVRAPRFPPGA